MTRSLCLPLLALWAVACQPVSTTPAPATKSPSPQPTSQASATPQEASNQPARDAALFGVWGNQQIVFQLAGNGQYQWRVNGQTLQGTWAIPRPGFIAFRSANGSTLLFQYQIARNHLAFKDQNGNVHYFARPNRAGGGPAPARPGVATKVNINDYNTQMQILRNPAKATASEIRGKWSNGMGVPTGSVYQSINTGQLSYGSMGHGHLMEFRADGTYAWVFRYAHRYLNCRNSVESMEVGRYRFDGTKLILQPSKTDADICSCCAGRKTKLSQDRAQRVFQVAFHPSKRYAVLRGTCTKTAQITCVGPANGKHLRIGLGR